MSRILMIVEVSRKQEYIFASKHLKENAMRSKDIAYVTDDAFFVREAEDLYQTDRNFVYSGGGHTVLQFDTEETARQFAQRITQSALTQYDGLELFAALRPYDESADAGSNLKALAERLEQKKALRKNAFRRMSFGVEALDGETFLPAALTALKTQPLPELSAPDGWRYPSEFSEMACGDNFIAVIHIDGNAMGQRVNDIYREENRSWPACCKTLRQFSEGIQSDFTAAFRETVDAAVVWRSRQLEQMTPEEALRVENPEALPIRPVILAGDDVCFVTAGSIGLECARTFLEKLSAKKNPTGGDNYAACAGVAIVHQKFPFHQASALAEELCDNAKRFGADLDAKRRISAMDWHIEFGQLKDSLSELRQDYNTEDGGRLELRPVTVVVPAGCKHADVRSYSFFKGMCRAMQGEYGRIARGKIKDLRTAFKQGETESRVMLRDRQIDDLLYHTVEAEHGENAIIEAWRELERLGQNGEKKTLKKSAYREFEEKTAENVVKTVRRCLFFDAIEMIDHCTFFEEAKA